MFCEYCGARVADGAKFCKNCGASLGTFEQKIDNASNTVNNVLSNADHQFADAVNDVRSAFNGNSRNNSGYANQGNYGIYPPNRYPGPNGGYPGRGPYGIPLKTDWSILVYILLGFITCGLYTYYFVYKIAEETNIACAGDGEETAGLLSFILLSIVTCSIYAWYWWYKLGNRLAANAPRYGLSFQENGTSVILWMLLGSVLCGIGVFIGINIIIKNANAIFFAYNRQKGYF